jgi:hypothetical protein
MVSRRRALLPAPPRATLLALAVLAAALAPTVRAFDNCELNNAVNMSELSLCGSNDWAEVMVGASPKCSFLKYQFVMGDYDCTTGQAVPKYYKAMPAKMKKDAFGYDENGVPGFMTLNKFRAFGKGVSKKTVDVEVWRARAPRALRAHRSWTGGARPRPTSPAAAPARARGPLTRPTRALRRRPAALCSLAT